MIKDLLAANGKLIVGVWGPLGQELNIRVMGPNEEYNFHIGILNRTSSEQNKANADFIVKACNSHYSLIDACETALKDMLLFYDIEKYGKDTTTYKIIEKLQNVLNKK